MQEQEQEQDSHEAVKQRSNGGGAQTHGGEAEYEARMRRQDLNEYRCREISALALRGGEVKPVLKY